MFVALSAGTERLLGATDQMRGSRVTVREVIEAIEADGWQKVRQTGSHRHYRHASKPGTVTVPGHLRDDLKPKTEASILKQAGLRK